MTQTTEIKVVHTPKILSTYAHRLLSRTRSNQTIRFRARIFFNQSIHKNCNVSLEFSTGQIGVNETMKLP